MKLWKRKLEAVMAAAAYAETMEWQIAAALLRGTQTDQKRYCDKKHHLYRSRQRMYREG